MKNTKYHTFNLHMSDKNGWCLSEGILKP